MKETPNPKSKWYWPLLRRGLMGLAVLATLAAALVTEEDWRAKHAWQAYRRAAEACGERLDLAGVIPRPEPDDQNFFAAPAVAEALKADRNDSNSVNRLRFEFERGDSAIWPTNGGYWQEGRLTDLRQWQTYFRTFNATAEGKTNGFPQAAQPQTPAADILLALSSFNPALEELRRASKRPGARLPLKYELGFEDAGELLPWLATEKRWGQFLQLRTLAELDAGQGEAALKDVQLSMRLMDGLRNQPLLISHLVRVALQAIALQPIYEGLALHRWNDAQLAELEAVLAEQDFLADFKSAMRGERTCAIQEFETERLTREMRAVGGEVGHEEIVTNSLRWMPSAYFYQNELAFARLYDQVVLPLVDLTNRTVSVAAYRTSEADYKAHLKHYSPYSAQAWMAFPSLAKCVLRFAIAQADVDLARVACALERYRLAHGEYPATLEALAPQCIEKLPHDIINGQPLHYRRTEDGKFVLYSIGWNEKDDGGTVALTKGGRVDLENGDWVWKY